MCQGGRPHKGLGCTGVLPLLSSFFLFSSFLFFSFLFFSFLFFSFLFFSLLFLSFPSLVYRLEPCSRYQDFLLVGAVTDFRLRHSTIELTDYKPKTCSLLSMHNVFLIRTVAIAYVSGASRCLLSPLCTIHSRQYNRPNDHLQADPPLGEGSRRTIESKKGAGRTLPPASFWTRSNGRAPKASRSYPEGPILVVRQWGETVKVSPLYQMLKVGARDQEVMEKSRERLRAGWPESAFSPPPL